MSDTLRRVMGIGLVWALLWLAVSMLLLAIIGVVEPDTIDPGEGPLAVGVIFGPMGFLSGVAFALLLRLRARADGLQRLRRVAASGILGTALVQIAYLGHGDAGLMANLQMALMFALFGGVVAMTWLVIERLWSRWCAPRLQTF